LGEQLFETEFFGDLGGCDGIHGGWSWGLQVNGGNDGCGCDGLRLLFCFGLGLLGLGLLDNRLVLRLVIWFLGLLFFIFSFLLFFVILFLVNEFAINIFVWLCFFSIFAFTWFG
jgi:hypothetical protein